MPFLPEAMLTVLQPFAGLFSRPVWAPVKESAMTDKNNMHDLQPDGVLPSAHLPPSKMRDIRVQMVPDAPPPPRRHLGPRHSVPPIPEGPEVLDPNPSPPVTIAPLEP